MNTESMLNELLDLLFPRRSLSEPSGFWMTEENWRALPFHPYAADREALTEKGISSLDRLVSAARYRDSDILQRAIHTVKYRNVPGLTMRLAELMVRAAGAYQHPDMVLVPVPLHPERSMERGFNQADLLAVRIATAMGLPVRRLLKRVRDTGHQAWRGKIERKLAVRDAFMVRKLCRVPKHVVLIDDIATTGATLDACASALKRGGARRVDAWVIARV